MIIKIGSVQALKLCLVGGWKSKIIKKCENKIFYFLFFSLYVFSNENRKVERLKLNYYYTLIKNRMIKKWSNLILFFFLILINLIFFHLFFPIWKKKKMVNPSKKLHPPPKVKRKTPNFFSRCLKNLILLWLIKVIPNAIIWNCIIIFLYFHLNVCREMSAKIVGQRVWIKFYLIYIRKYIEMPILI